MAKKETYTRNGRKFNLHLHFITIEYSEILKAKVISSFILGIILVFSVLVFIFSKESIYIYDPLDNMKNNFLDIKLFGIIFGIMMTIISFTKLKTRNAFKVIIATLACIIISTIISVFMMLNMASKYDDAYMSEMYSESYLKVDVEGDMQSLFVNECRKLNNNFQTKIIIISIMEYLMIFVNLYLLVSESKMKEIYEQTQRDNEVLFDEEINVKI